MAYEDVEQLQPCAVCGSRRYCFATFVLTGN